jgi:hypothetical protein
MATSSKQLSVKDFSCFGDLTLLPMNISSMNFGKFFSIIHAHVNQLDNCHDICSTNTSINKTACIECLNTLYYLAHSIDDLFVLKNGLKFVDDASNPRYLLQTVRYQWQITSQLNYFHEWQHLIEYIRNHFITRFYSKNFSHISFWWTSELFSTFTLMEQLQQEKFVLVAIKFSVILIFLTLFTGILGVFVTLTALFNFATCVATLTLLNYTITVENMSHFVVTLIISSQYSVLYAIR